MENSDTFSLEVLMADAKVTDLSETSVPALDDVFYGADVSDTTDDAAGSSRKFSIARLIGLVNNACQGRLTLETGVAISTSDQTAKTTIYFTPYLGNKIALYDGTRWKLYSFTEKSLALGTLTDAQNYDVFIYDNAGTLTLEALAWTNDTTRATALTTQDGVYVKTGATTRRYLGTFRTTSTTTTEDSAAKRLVWNYYNRVARRLVKSDATDHNYVTAAWRAWNNDTANRVGFVCGLAEDSILVMVRGSLRTAGGAIYTSVIMDATNGDDFGISIKGSADTEITAATMKQYVPQIGYHFLQATEFSFEAGTNHFWNYNIEAAVMG